MSDGISNQTESQQSIEKKSKIRIVWDNEIPETDEQSPEKLDECNPNKSSEEIPMDTEKGINRFDYRRYVDEYLESLGINDRKQNTTIEIKNLTINV